MWARGLAAMLLVTALLVQPSHGKRLVNPFDNLFRSSFGKFMNDLFGKSQSMDADLQQLLRDRSLDDAIACLEQHGVYEYVHMIMLKV
jgi:hypothetical protein